MKKLTTFLLSLLVSVSVYSQQSKAISFAPQNTDRGKIYSSKTQVLIDNVPSYLWHRGCGPTALGMVLGYYDINGFHDMISGPSNTQTSLVNDAMANDEHYDDYSLPLDYYPNLEEDNSELGGAHESNCLADFMETSWSSQGNYWGWSWSNDIAPALESYKNMINPDYGIFTSYNYFNTGSWNEFMTEIDNDRPVVILVDTDGDGYTDHFVTGIGYDDSNNNYAIYDTWDNDVHWYEWREMSNGVTWGIYGFNIFELSRNNIPLVYSDEAGTISSNSAELPANISDDFGFDVYESGFIYSTEKNLLIGGAGVQQAQTLPVVTEGEYSMTISGLDSETTYYYRAYSINSNGTGYSDIKSFETLVGNNIELLSDNFGISVFPNPANDILNINIEKINYYIKMQVYDITGKKVKTINNLQYKNIFDISSLSKGVYFLNIKIDDYLYSTKIVKK